MFTLECQMFILFFLYALLSAYLSLPCPTLLPQPCHTRQRGVGVRSGCLLQCFSNLNILDQCLYYQCELSSSGILDKSSYHSRSFIYPHYNKSTQQARKGLSQWFPDARLVAHTVEAISVRKFAMLRSDCCRSPNGEGLAWCRAQDRTGEPAADHALVSQSAVWMRF